ncbi:MAG TPA: hypothetical protein VFE47_12005 [Tepidisphaeraceae bacterium]|jgi:hypothetical protein|nr:hypothetical protein [Tepidisphaeraceae bacterium]
MRSFLAGLVFLLLVSSGALAQVTGFVESVGIGDCIRPDCWNPIRVNLKSQISEPMQYQLQVWQEDLDKDRVVYTREITLSPQVREKFDVYFVPQKSLGNDQLISPGEAQRSIHVRVCLPPGEGKKPDDAKVVIDRLPVTFGLTDIDPVRTGFDWKKPGVRLVLVVTDGSSALTFRGYDKAAGLAEFVDMIPVNPSDLGENALYYDAVDAVVWLSGNADDLDASGAHRRAALEQYVREGGKLIVCQSTDLHKIEALGPLLPVETKDANGNWQITFGEKKTLVDEKKAAPGSPERDALAVLAQPVSYTLKVNTYWHLLDADGKNPIKIARPKLRANSVVEVWEPWSAKEKTPYLVRAPRGLGSVTWVAQDLGDKALVGSDPDVWAHVWDRVIGWRQNTFTVDDAIGDSNADREKGNRENGEGDIDLSKWMNQGTDYASKGAAYVFLAVLFFILYWVAAGPGTYLFLSRKKRKELNWFIFGAWAFAGTALTVLLVRLVLRGDAEIRHLTVVRQVIGEPAYIYSRVGLYIPRDGDQTIALDDTSKDALSYITPLQLHPQYVGDTEFPASQVYGIPIHDDPQPVSIRVPFRSTLKKLQVRWVGDLKGGIDGSAKLIPPTINKGASGYISGTLINSTGTDLKYVYFVFNYLGHNGTSQDICLYVPKWKKDTPIDLNAEYAGAKDLGTNDSVITTAADPRNANNTSSIKSPIGGKNGLTGWENYWTRWTGGGAMGGGDDSRGQADFESAVPKAFPLLSLFDRIAPGLNDPQNHNRVDFVRRGGTILNMSPSVAAGRLVILAQSDNDEKPLPFTLNVQGSRVGGEGRVLYQFALPVDRSEMEKDAAKNEAKSE